MAYQLDRKTLISFVKTDFMVNHLEPFPYHSKFSKRKYPDISAEVLDDHEYKAESKMSWILGYGDEGAWLKDNETGLLHVLIRGNQIIAASFSPMGVTCSRCGGQHDSSFGFVEPW